MPCDMVGLEPGWMKSPYRMDGWSPDRFPQPEEPYANGLTGREMHNIIPTLYSKIMYEGYQQHTGLRGMNFTPNCVID